MQGGEEDNECERDSTIADANHDDRIDAEYQERPALFKAVDSIPSAPSSRPKGPAVLIQEFTRSGVQELAQS